MSKTPVTFRLQQALWAAFVLLVSGCATTHAPCGDAGCEPPVFRFSKKQLDRALEGTANLCNGLKANCDEDNVCSSNPNVYSALAAPAPLLERLKVLRSEARPSYIVCQLRGKDNNGPQQMVCAAVQQPAAR